MAKKKNKGIKTSSPESRRLMVRLLKEHVRPYRGRVFLAMFFMLVVSACAAGQAQLFDPVINQVFMEKDPDKLWFIAGLVLLVAVVNGGATAAQGMYIEGVGHGIVSDVQHRMFDHLMRMDLAYYHDIHSAKLVSHFLYDVAMLRESVSKSVVALVRDSTTAFGLIGLMYWKDWRLAFVVTVVLPLLIGPLRKLNKRLRRFAVDNQEQTGQFSTLLNEVIQGIRYVKAFNMEEIEQKRAHASIEQRRKTILKAVYARAMTSPLMETVGGIGFAGVILYGGSRVIDGLATPGEFFSFMAAMIMVYPRLKSLASLNNALQDGIAAAARIFETLDRQPKIDDQPGAKNLEVSGGEVRFDAVTFAYDPTNPVLQQISLVAEAGKKTALVGPSGGGKSTILNMIPRFYDADGGAIIVDGQPIKDIGITSLRNAIGFVGQEPILFDDTIGNNIRYGKLDASDDEVRVAAQAAAAWDFIQEMPEALNTLVGERGVKLSGGQRQRIAIARAFLKNAPILLLDEATSALDTESERQVQEALNALMQGRTSVVIAHRLSTIIDADCIYVIEAGKVVEKGSHQELLGLGGLYAALYQTQGTELVIPIPKVS